MDDPKDNPLPQILNPSDLPTRRRPSTTTSKPGPSLFASLLPSTLQDEGYFSSTSAPSSPSSSPAEESPEPIDPLEIYDLISTISDPEHPLSLGSLAVVNLADISITPPSSPNSRISTVTVLITPTITHCSLATVIGLGVRVRLEQSLPPRFRVDVRIKEGTHSTAEAVNKQLGDKERVAAAMENGTLVGVVRRMLSTCV
ncbi:MIP18 family protein [Elsinoe fawcettii]|nr:MIP18 family protein [Elsinoe fawcettii]